jgi:hypothetical protein
MDYLMQKTKNEGLEQKIELMRSQGSQSQLDRIERQTMAKLRELAEIRSFITQCNEPKEVLEDSKVERLKAIAQRNYFDDDGVKKTFLTQDELENLSVRKGSITEAERKIMKEHAYMTLKMLHQIPFTKKFKNIPHYAGAHHECIDGSGYPLGLKGDEIPFAGKLMAVTDIAEALTSAERPYKDAMPEEEVNRILRAMAQKGKLDPELVELFINENVYEIYKRNYEPNSLEDPKSTSCGTKRESASHASAA